VVILKAKDLPTADQVVIPNDSAPRTPFYNCLLTSIIFTHGSKSLKSSLIRRCYRRWWVLTIVKWRKILQNFSQIFVK